MTDRSRTLADLQFHAGRLYIDRAWVAAFHQRPGRGDRGPVRRERGFFHEVDDGAHGREQQLMIEKDRAHGKSSLVAQAGTRGRR
jgi:hypothetical protein